MRILVGSEKGAYLLEESGSDWRVEGPLFPGWKVTAFGQAPEQQIYDSLRHFKQVMEAGEVVRSEASGDGTWIVQRPAQPPPDPSRR